jgi:hypothetical protein
MAGRLPPSPTIWRKHASTFPYHNNLGTSHTPPSGVIRVRAINTMAKSVHMD